MTNLEISEAMTALASVYAQPENADLRAPALMVNAYSKDEVLRLIRAVGGRFVKAEVLSGDYLEFTSVRVPGFVIWIPRDRVCRKVVTWDCEPLLSDADIAEVVEVHG